MTRTPAKNMRPVNEARNELAKTASEFGDYILPGLSGVEIHAQQLAKLCKAASRYVAACLKAGVAP